MKKHRKPRRSRRTRKEEYDQDDDMDGPVIDESMLSVKELLGLQQAEDRLKRDSIYRLKKVTTLSLYIQYSHILIHMVLICELRDQRLALLLKNSTLLS